MTGRRWLPLLALCAAATASEFEQSHFNCSAPDSAYPTLTCSVRGMAHPDRRPVQWVHVPKTGTSFANVVYRVACAALPPWAAIRVTASCCPHGMMVPYFATCFPAAMSGCLLHGGAARNQRHQHVGAHFEPRRVAYVTMLREPIARLVSGCAVALWTTYVRRRRERI